MLIALLLAAAVGTILVIGSQTRVPAPFGPADNGVLLASTLDGTLITIDPNTGKTSPLGDLPDRWYPWFSRDGSTIVYHSRALGSDPKSGKPITALMIANADGSNPRELLRTSIEVGWVEFSPSGEQLLVATDPADGQDVWLFDTTTLVDQRLDMGMLIDQPVFRPNGEIVFRGETAFPNTSWGYYASSTASPTATPDPADGQQRARVWDLARWLHAGVFQIGHPEGDRVPGPCRRYRHRS